MKQFMDIFSIPEMTLLAAANDFFITNDIDYDPVHLFKDVSVSTPADSYSKPYIQCFQSCPHPLSPTDKVYRASVFHCFHAL